MTEYENLWEIKENCVTFEMNGKTTNKKNYNKK